MKSSLVQAAVFLATVAAAVPAMAQSEADFVKAFAGNWQVFERSYASEAGKLCTLALSDSADNGKYVLQSQNCDDELAGASGWGIAAGQLAIFDGKGTILANLGGNQQRISGTTASGKPLVIDRANGHDAGEAINAAAKARGCHYLGFSSTCAAVSELANPFAASPEAQTKVNVVVNLNVRSEARSDAGIVGIIPQNSCVTVDRCLTASDGVWCEAKFGDKHGWIRKLALRQNTWPIVTFTNNCS